MSTNIKCSYTKKFQPLKHSSTLTFYLSPEKVLYNFIIIFFHLFFCKHHYQGLCYQSNLLNGWVMIELKHMKLDSSRAMMVLTIGALVTTLDQIRPIFEGKCTWILPDRWRATYLSPCDCDMMVTDWSRYHTVTWFDQRQTWCMYSFPQPVLCGGLDQCVHSSFVMLVYIPHINITASVIMGHMFSLVQLSVFCQPFCMIRFSLGAPEVDGCGT